MRSCAPQVNRTRVFKMANPAGRAVASGGFYAPVNHRPQPASSSNSSFVCHPPDGESFYPYAAFDTSGQPHRPNVSDPKLNQIIFMLEKQQESIHSIKEEVNSSEKCFAVCILLFNVTLDGYTERSSSKTCR